MSGIGPEPRDHNNRTLRARDYVTITAEIKGVMFLDGRGQYIMVEAVHGDDCNKKHPFFICCHASMVELVERPVL